MGSKGGRSRPTPQARAQKPTTTDTRQRATVKVAYTSKAQVRARGGDFNQAMKDHLGYISRDGAGVDGDRPDIFTESEELGKQTSIDPIPMKGEQRFYKIILSPENGSKIDMEEYARAFMKDTEAAMGQRLNWIASTHKNTDNPHVHIVVRGVDKDGNQVDFRKAPDLVKKTMREIAQDRATERLGHRSLRDIERQARNEIQADRFTQIDRRIQRNIESGRRMRPEEIQRLIVLTSRGLAEKTRGGYALKDGWDETLKRRGREGDILKNMDYRGAGVSFSDAKMNARGVVIEKGVKDELYDKSFVLIRTADGRDVYYDGNGVKGMKKGDEIKLEGGKAFKIERTQEHERGREAGPEHDRERRMK